VQKRYESQRAEIPEHATIMNSTVDTQNNKDEFDTRRTKHAKHTKQHKHNNNKKQRLTRQKCRKL
jgi:hypothetical protein